MSSQTILLTWMVIVSFQLGALFALRGAHQGPGLVDGLVIVMEVLVSILALAVLAIYEIPGLFDRWVQLLPGPTTMEVYLEIANPYYLTPVVLVKVIAASLLSVLVIGGPAMAAYAAVELSHLRDWLNKRKSKQQLRDKPVAW